MKKIDRLFLSLSSILLVIVALIGFYQRNGNDRVQALPAFLIGTGLISYKAFFRNRRRSKLFLAIRALKNNES